MKSHSNIVVNVENVPEESHLEGDHWGGHYKVLTPSMRDRGGQLGVNLTRVPPGRAVCPMHHHQHEDEVFYILSGSGTLRYGDELTALGAGDCISCPAGTGIAHQIANTGDEDLTYLAIGNHDPNEVCTYPDSDKVMVRSLNFVGTITKTAYLAGESSPPTLFELVGSQNQTP